MEIRGIQGSLGARLTEIEAARSQGALSQARGADKTEAGEHFEAMFASMLCRELRSGLDEGFFGSGPGADTFSAWLDEHVGRVMAERGSLGVARMIDRFAAGESGAVQAEPSEDVR